MFDLYDAVPVLAGGMSVPGLCRTFFSFLFFFVSSPNLISPVRSFLVDACMRLLAHVETEGLFRKSGSVVRLKALRVSDA